MDTERRIPNRKTPSRRRFEEGPREPNTFGPLVLRNLINPLRIGWIMSEPGVSNTTFYDREEDEMRKPSFQFQVVLFGCIVAPSLSK
jgi:hypothetical protein